MALLYEATDWHEGDFDPANVSLAEWEFIYEHGGWLKQGSGPGSLLENNTELIEWLKDFIAGNNASSILDIGCVTFNGLFKRWMVYPTKVLTGLLLL